MLDLDPNRPPSAPKPAATVLVLRPAADAVEVFCVRRHAKSAFLGGAVVFPGGKLDEADRDPAWTALVGDVHPRAALLADAIAPQALAVCAAREVLEEAALAATTPVIDGDVAETLQDALADGAVLREELTSRGLVLDTAALVPFGRWVTPEAEARRFDARFYLMAAPPAQEGRHDRRETTSSVWATPSRMLESYAASDLFLAPPTIRCLELLKEVHSIADALAVAAAQSLLPICPRFVPGDEPVLALPGDSAHEVREARVAGPSRFVLRDGLFVGEDG